ncbi:MAG: right-handed parallel beta-helix repeat-containing protein, partial [Gemmatimonadota bacterium]|nr:right-handed parallel beta-helix repeat-containing protein [Gemmatimonadota bacterium]
SSPEEAWQTLQRVADAVLQPGDVVLLRAGATFVGGVMFHPENLSSSEAEPVRFARYGEGADPIITAAADQRALMFYNVGGVHVERLDLRGAGAGSATQHGLDVYTDLPGRRPPVTLRGVQARGFRDGIAVGSWAGDAGFAAITIEDCTMTENGNNGLSIFAEHQWSPGKYFTPHRNVVVRGVRSHQNLGRAGENSGFGILAYGIDGGVIENCATWENGATGGRSGAGPFGIMVMSSRGVVVRRCYSHHNKSATVDGGGIDLDGDCINCTVEHCYTHDNMAAGYFMAAFSGSGEYAGNVIRYCISENDGRGNSPRAGISVWRMSSLSTHKNNRIYGNTIYLAKPTSKSAAALDLRSATTDLQVMNNIFVVRGGALLIESVGGHNNLRLDGNSYHAEDGQHIYRFAGSDYSSLAALREATVHEQSGLQETPLLVAAGAGGDAPGGDLQAVSAYRLQPESRMPTAGLDLRAQGFTLPAADYYGNAIPLTGEFCAIGAAAVAEQAPAPPEDPPPPPGNPKLHTLTESFSGGALDTSKWTTSLNRRGSLVVKDQLELNLSSGGTGWVTCTSVGAYALTGSHATTEVKQLGTQPALYAAFSLRASDDNLLAWAHEPSSGLLAVKSVGGEQIVLWSGLYNATTHRWWRIRESGGMVFWETSSDGAAWTTHHSEAASIPIAALQVSFHAERRAGTGSTQKVIFDNLNPA